MTTNPGSRVFAGSTVHDKYTFLVNVKKQAMFVKKRTMIMLTKKAG